MDGKILRASAFLKRAEEACDLQQKLLCLYDGFVCLYGPMDACIKAAAASGLARDLLDRAVDSCMDEGDSPADGETESRHVEITEEMVARLSSALASVVENAE